MDVELMLALQTETLTVVHHLADGALYELASVDLTGRSLKGTRFKRCRVGLWASSSSSFGDLTFDQCVFYGDGWPDGWCKGIGNFGVRHLNGHISPPPPPGAPKDWDLDKAINSSLDAPVVRWLNGEPRNDAAAVTAGGETDSDYRARVLRVVGEADRAAALTATGTRLDAIGRRCNRFRYGAPLEPAPAAYPKASLAGYVLHFWPDGDPARSIDLGPGIGPDEIRIESQVPFKREMTLALDEAMRFRSELPGAGGKVWKLGGREIEILGSHTLPDGREQVQYRYRDGEPR